MNDAATGFSVDGELAREGRRDTAPLEQRTERSPMSVADSTGLNAASSSTTLNHYHFRR
jgi:hypothetical protein